MDVRLKEFLKLPVEPNTEWQGGVFEFGDLFGVELPDSPLEMPRVALWVSCEFEWVHANPDNGPEPLTHLISELLVFQKTQNFNYRPERICVANEELASQLAVYLEATGTSVTWNPEPTFWSYCKADMAAHFGSMSETPSLSDSGCSLAQIRAFAEASAAFFRARPWQYFDDTDLLHIKTPKPPRFLKHAAVMGAGRQEYGLGFYDSADIHWDIRAQRADMSSLQLFSMTYIPISDASKRDAEFWNKHELPLETGSAFPQLLFLSADGPRVPKPQELEYVTVVLAALSETTESEIDSGEWSKQVAVSGKKKRCKICLPDLLDPPDRRVWMDRGIMPDRRGNERHFRLVQSVMEQNNGMGMEELNQLLNSQFTGSIDDFDYPSETPFDRAENLYYAAIDAQGRRRIQLARQALEEDPTHIDANVLLADSTNDTTRTIEMFKNAVELGETQLGERLENEVGHFWGITETRPYMRAKYGLANSLAVNGQANEAIAEMLDILRLNSDDNLGVRYEVIPLLLVQNREQEATEVLERYREETGNWLYLKAQVEFRLGGPSSSSARKAMNSAFRFNPHVVEQLMSDGPPLMPENYALGSPEEGAVIIQEQFDSWTETDGFIEWMFARFAAREREASKRKRDKKRIQRKKTNKKRKKTRR